MPDMCVPPPNQCFTDGSDGSDPAFETSAGPPPPPPSIQPTASFGGTDGAEGGDNAGSDELVRRFAGDGSGGAPGAAGAQSSSEKSCLAEELRAMSSCGSTVLNALGKGAPSAVIAGLGCVGAAIAVLNCQTKSDAVSGH